LLWFAIHDNFYKRFFFHVFSRHSGKLSSISFSATLLTFLQSSSSSMSSSSSPWVLLPSPFESFPDINEIIAAAIEKLEREHFDHMIAEIEAGWECAVLSDEEEEELEWAWGMMKSHAKSLRLRADWIVCE
jgi:hypothetical protein